LGWCFDLARALRLADEPRHQRLVLALLVDVLADLDT
jgi:hypothetical protein